MSELTYEGMFVIDSGKFAANTEGVTKEVHAIIERAGGKILASRPWQDTKIAYVMDGHRRGMYLLTYFTLDTLKVTEVDRLVKFNDSIIRHLVIALDPALVQPMLAMAMGTGEVVSSFRDTEAVGMGGEGGGGGGGRGRDGEGRRDDR